MEKNPQHLCTPSPSRGKSPAALSVWCKSLGCPKNRVDTEKLLGSLGMPITEAEDIRQARLVFVNTCGFITPAVKESIDSILEIIRDLEDVKHRPLLAVGGCMVGRYGAEELARELPEVDLWLPTADMLRWPDRIREKRKEKFRGASFPVQPPTHGSRYPKDAAITVPSAPFPPYAAHSNRVPWTKSWLKPGIFWLPA